MIQDSINETDEILDEIYDEVSPEHAVVAKKKFKPWHHPRKHWVRLNQLCRLSRDLISETHFLDNTFRYLTLPGEELADIHSMETITRSGSEELIDIQAVEGVFYRGHGKNLKLKYIGFNSIGRSSIKKNKEKLANLELAESTIKDSKNIDQSSRVINDRVQHIAINGSSSCKMVKENGPYNVINLDLCTSVADSDPEENNPTYFDAIGQILDLQRSHMSEPFIMFIASKTTPSEIHPKSIHSISEVYKANFSSSSKFKEKFEEILKGEADQLLSQILSGDKIEQDRLNKFFGVGLGKWLLHIMKPSAPHWDVTLEDICCYSIGGYEENMLTLAFKFKKVTEEINDKFGFIKKLTSEEPISTETKVNSEQDLALQMLENSKEIPNVDVILEEDKKTRERIIRQAGQVLEKSGYSLQEYKNWANSQLELSSISAISLQ